MTHQQQALSKRRNVDPSAHRKQLGLAPVTKIMTDGGVTHLGASRAPVEGRDAVVAHGEGPKRVDALGLLELLRRRRVVVLFCLRPSSSPTTSNSSVDAGRKSVQGRVQLEPGLDLEEAAVEEGVRFVGVDGGLEDGEAVFELADAVAHVLDLFVEAVCVREDEPTEDGVEGRSPPECTQRCLPTP